ncbi:MAG: hypothetical protein IPO37_03550 [Saprospiraceae bacterium]|nr:hypothetical protein [Saprospiraceae bacterium]
MTSTAMNVKMDKLPKQSVHPIRYQNQGMHMDEPDHGGQHKPSNQPMVTRLKKLKV